MALIPIRGSRSTPAASLVALLPFALALTLLAQTPPRTLPPTRAHVPAMSAADQAALRTALEAYDAGNATQAEPILRDLTARYPRSFEASEALGSIYAEANDSARALPYLERAATLSPRQPLARANLGAAYLKLNRIPDALRELHTAAALDPANPATQSNLGQAYMLAKQPGPAAAAFQIASQAEPTNPDLRYNWALALAESNNPKQAAAVLAALPPDAAAGDQIQSLAGDLDEKLGNYQSAVLHYQAAAQANPSDANIYALTVELLRHWTWSEALTIANFGASRYPQSIHFEVAAGIALYGDSKYPAAAQTFSTLLARDPENALYADLLGRSCSLIAEGEVADCQRLDDFARTHPKNARAAMYAATAILHRPAAEQDTARAELLLNQSIAADPTLSEAFYQLGVLHQQRSQWKESSVVLEKAIALRPAYAEARYRLSRAYAHMGLRDEAQKQIALQQQYSQQEKDHLNARLQEVVTFLLKGD